MIINKIILDEFASYKKEEIEIDKLGNLINISGPTGAGKTTLIVDAITFCLFGKVYGEEKTGSERFAINPRRNRAKAELIFTVENKKYKISREVFKNYPSKVILFEFKDNSWIKKAFGVKEVEKEINKILKFDYRTFINTIAIRQGDVIYLLEASPKDRREIFLKAFNLDFSKYLEKAKENKKLIENKISNKKGELNILKEEIRKKNEIEKEKLEMEKNLNKIKENLEILNNLKEKVKNEIDKEEKEYANLNLKFKQYVSIKEIYEKRNEEMKIKMEKIEKYLKEINKKDEMKRNLKNLENELKEIEEAIKIVNEIEIKEKEKLGEEKLLKEKEIKIKKIQDLENKIIEIKKAKNDLKKVEEIYEKINLEIEKIKNEKIKNESYKDQIIKIIEIFKTSDLKETKCPLCKTELTKEKINELYEHYKKERKKLEEEINKLNYNLNKKNEEKKYIEKEKEKLILKISSEEAFLIEIKEKENIFKEINEIKNKINEIKNKINELKSKKEYVKYKDKKIDEIYKYKKEIEDKKEIISKNLSLIENYEKEVIELKKEVEKIEKEILNLKEKIKEKPDEEKLSKIEKKLKEEKQKYEMIQKEIEDYLKKMGEIKGIISDKEILLKKIEEKEEKYKKIIKEIEELEFNLEIYNILTNDIFNERGFPLKLLDDYLEDLTSYINEEILVKILPKKRIEIKREEDKIIINVIDDIHKRELATYSGGEKTAIGFALRLAIAKLLAIHRLGVIPKFLIIDEGFGPLSSEFRSAIISSLSNLIKDYKKIFIISHLEDIQENPIFDTCVKIYKDENEVSHIEILK